jgi:hypothetical protein
LNQGHRQKKRIASTQRRVTAFSAIFWPDLTSRRDHPFWLEIDGINGRRGDSDNSISVQQSILATT